MPDCRTVGCVKPAKASRGLCHTCYRYVRRGEDPAAAPRFHRGKPCTIEGCGRPNYSNGVCEVHHKRACRHDGDPLGGLWTDAIPEGHEGDAAPVELGVISRRHREQGFNEPAVPDSAPLKTIRLQLEHERMQGYAFEFAWSHAIAALPLDLRAEWADTLRNTKLWWARAYDRLPEPKPFPVDRLHFDAADWASA